jgi:hypothetical protein
VVEGDLPAALADARESVRLTRAGRDFFAMSWALSGLAMILLIDGEPVQGESLFLEALALAHDYSNSPALASCLAGLAGTALACAPCTDGGPPDALRAARLLGAAQRVSESTGVRPWPLAEEALARIEESVRYVLDEESFAKEREAGRHLSSKEAVILAREKYGSRAPGVAGT